MFRLPSNLDWWKYDHLWVMKIQWREPICHSVWEKCKHTQITAKEILEAQVGLMSQHIDTEYQKTYKDEEMHLSESPKQLTVKEAAQLIWYSFRFSNGNAGLQFTMIHQAWKKYWNQNLSVEEVFKEFKKLLQVWKTHTRTTEYENKNWRPPHPKVHRFTTETHTEIWLSETESHKRITSDYIKETDEVIQMLLFWKWRLARFWWRYDWKINISRSKKLEQKGAIIQEIFEADFWYLCKSNWEWVFEWRPWRNPKNDGKNNLKDRFFSYLVWFCINRNTTWNDFFDEYFWELQDFFPAWFAWLPSDQELIGKNKLEQEQNDWYHDKKSMRKDPYWNFTQITKEDVLTVIARYNTTHPDTQVSMTELWLSEFPQYRSILLKDS